MSLACRHLIIKGKVQGVYFRASAKELAEKLNLHGWVRNTDEGHVEILVSGPEAQTNQFLQWCHEGPGGSRVDSVTELSAIGHEAGDGFRIIR